MEKLQVSPSIWIMLGPIVLVVASVLLLVLLARSKRRPADEGWKGVFYSNPNDSALFVPKRYGIGYTLNFANPWSWVVLIIVFGLVAAPIIYSAAFLRNLPR
jgi:uncharacterized membrane protein